MTALPRIAAIQRLAYYNEIDPFAAQWLRNLIAKGLIADGDVDERSILDVRAADLVGYSQCHFFAGIGGWPYALRLSGWPDEAHAWTGSCPCQPLSVAGQRKGHVDERHVWPAFFGLIAERRPSIVFGEQVASKDGREWLAGVRADLEDVGYACGASDLCAAGVGAPHQRARIYWLADAHSSQRRAFAEGRNVVNGADGGRQETAGGHAVHSQNGSTRLADAGHDGRPAWGSGCQQQSETSVCQERRCDRERMGDAPSERLERAKQFWDEYDICARPGDTSGRRVKPGVRLLADGVPNRMGRLRAYGNAIVPQVAAQFVSAWVETRREAA